MAFFNERIPKEERCEYILSHRTITPKSWTIDKDRNIKLFKYWSNIDDPNEKLFALIWHEYVIEIVMYQKMQGNTVYWYLKGINIPKEINSVEQDILIDLRNAMKIYGCGYQFSNWITESDVEVEIKLCF